MTSAAELRNVTVRLGGRTVLQDVNLAVEDGHFIGVLGANGSGKTTLMRAILGLIPVASGQIRVFGRPAGRGSTVVGYMPQIRSTISTVRFTGWDFVASAAGGHRWGLPRLGRAERADVERVLDLVGAGDLAHRSLAETSGGERQRLLLAQALLGKPRLLLLDEPLISLDPAHQHGVVELVARLHRELKIAVLFTAHELNPLLGAIDEVLYLGAGKAVLGAVDEVITGPVLSRLYNSQIEVVRLGGRIFVMAGDYDMERDAHRHDHDDHDAHARDHHYDHGHHVR